MMKRKLVIKLHRQLWHWLAMNPGRGKMSWPRWKHNGGTIEEVKNSCFACESTCLPGDYNVTDLEYYYGAAATVAIDAAATLTGGQRVHCSLCPFIWISNQTREAVVPCEYYQSPYTKWEEAIVEYMADRTPATRDEITYWASIIRDLEPRDIK